MAAHYYIYYRVRDEQSQHAGALARALQSAIEHRLGIAGRYLRRRDEPLLRMEIYEHVIDTGAFESALAELVALHRLNDVLVEGSTRHIECFVE